MNYATPETELPDLLNQLAQQWREEDIEPGKGMAEAKIAEYERQYGVCIPPDLRLYLSTLNGTAKGDDADGAFVAFHGLTTYRLFFFTPPNQWQRVADYEGERRPPDAQLCFEIADWMIDSAVVGVFLTTQSQATTPIYSLFNLASQPMQIATSIGEFIQSYLAYDTHQIVDYFYGDIPA